MSEAGNGAAPAVKDEAARGTAPSDRVRAQGVGSYSAIRLRLQTGLASCVCTGRKRPAQPGHQRPAGRIGTLQSEAAYPVSEGRNHAVHAVDVL